MAGDGAGATWRRRLRMPGLFVPCLVPQDERGGRRCRLASGVTVVGREAAADLVLPYPQISGIHARLERRGTRLLVRDLGSVNGTFVNGLAVREQELRPGDTVGFADVVFAVRSTPVPTWPLGLALAVVALIALGIWAVPRLVDTGPRVEKLWTREMHLEQAQRSIDEAVRAYDRRPRPVEVARGQFDIAIRSLIEADRLRPDRQTPEELAGVLREAAEDVDRLAGRDVYRIYRDLQERPAPAAPAPARAFSLEDEVAAILAEFGIDTQEQPIPAGLLAEVERFVAYWTEEMRGFTERAMARAQPHLAMIRAELRRNQLPEVFCYLPFVESGFRPAIVSSAGARGFWQFMPKTAAKYGLRVDDAVDERTDPRLSTIAACRYLNDLLSMFGANAFMCAVASYNKGEYGMLNCLRGVSWRSSWKYWDIVAKNDGCLKRETVEYVPKFLAAVVVLRRPEIFGFAS
jgi:hypothetical protein